MSNVRRVPSVPSSRQQPGTHAPTASTTQPPSSFHHHAALVPGTAASARSASTGSNAAPSHVRTQSPSKIPARAAAAVPRTAFDGGRQAPHVPRSRANSGTQPPPLPQHRAVAGHDGGSFGSAVARAVSPQALSQSEQRVPPNSPASGSSQPSGGPSPALMSVMAVDGDWLTTNTTPNESMGYPPEPHASPASSMSFTALQAQRLLEAGGAGPGSGPRTPATTPVNMMLEPTAAAKTVQNGTSSRTGGGRGNRAESIAYPPEPHPTPVSQSLAGSMLRAVPPEFHGNGNGSGHGTPPTPAATPVNWMLERSSFVKTASASQSTTQPPEPRPSPASPALNGGPGALHPNAHRQPLINGVAKNTPHQQSQQQPPTPATTPVNMMLQPARAQVSDASARSSASQSMVCPPEPRTSLASSFAGPQAPAPSPAGGPLNATARGGHVIQVPSGSMLSSPSFAAVYDARSPMWLSQNSTGCSTPYASLSENRLLNASEPEGHGDGRPRRASVRDVPPPALEMREPSPSTDILMDPPPPLNMQNLARLQNSSANNSFAWTRQDTGDYPPTPPPSPAVMTTTASGPAMDANACWGHAASDRAGSGGCLSDTHRPPHSTPPSERMHTPPPPPSVTESYSSGPIPPHVGAGTAPYYRVDTSLTQMSTAAYRRDNAARTQAAAVHALASQRRATLLLRYFTSWRWGTVVRQRSVMAETSVSRQRHASASTASVARAPIQATTPSASAAAPTRHADPRAAVRSVSPDANAASKGSARGGSAPPEDVVYIPRRSPSVPDTRVCEGEVVPAARPQAHAQARVSPAEYLRQRSQRASDTTSVTTNPTSSTAAAAGATFRPLPAQSVQSHAALPADASPIARLRAAESQGDYSPAGGPAPKAAATIHESAATSRTASSLRPPLVPASRIPATAAYAGTVSGALAAFAENTARDAAESEMDAATAAIVARLRGRAQAISEEIIASPERRREADDRRWQHELFATDRSWRPPSSEPLPSEGRSASTATVDIGDL